MTFAEIKKQLEEYIPKWAEENKCEEEYFWSCVGDGDGVQIRKDLGFTVVEDYGGEGMGDTRYIVMHFTEPDIYVKKNGWYASFDGSNWDGKLEAVKAVQKTITVYE